MQIEVAPTIPPQESLIITTADNTEAQLLTEVGSLWRVHSSASANLSKSRNELKALRGDLARKLHELKSLLSRPGRGGAWSSFLASEGMPRSTADRLVRSYGKTHSSNEKNCTTEQISEPAEVVARRYLQELWPKLSRVLTTREAVEAFIAELKRRVDESLSAAADALRKG